MLLKFVHICCLSLVYVTSCHTILVHCMKIRCEIQFQHCSNIILLYIIYENHFNMNYNLLHLILSLNIRWLDCPLTYLISWIEKYSKSTYLNVVLLLLFFKKVYIDRSWSQHQNVWDYLHNPCFSALKLLTHWYIFYEEIGYLLGN